MQTRLQKILSTAGISSRRAAETLIVEGRVTVNGTPVTELGSKADPDTDDIRVDGRRVKIASRRRYILMYKPRGYITSRMDPEQRPTVNDLLLKGGVRDYIYPVGRLDYESEGLLLLTSDGDLAEKLMHPSHAVPREYHVRVRGVPTEETLDRLSRGIVLDGRKTAPAQIEIIKQVESSSGGDAILSVLIHEGRNRQVRRMCEAVGHPVSRLKRVRIGPITDGDIRPGEFRDLSDKEVAALKREAALEPAKRKPAEPQRTPGIKTGLTRKAGSPRTSRASRPSPGPRSDRPRRG
ncbi:MAG: rRNA pseudouridine synthase [Acidobacteriota bacterium]|nr:rRNA pseudouridine synthase [Acidobacteriota bacterium]